MISVSFALIRLAFIFSCILIDKAPPGAICIPAKLQATLAHLLVIATLLPKAFLPGQSISSKSFLVLSVYITMAILLSLMLVAIMIMYTLADSPKVMSSDEIRAAYRLYGFHNCNREQENSVLQALNDKHLITGARGVQSINWHSAAAIDYFG
jgi:Mg2+/Co2+ transporter CorB